MRYIITFLILIFSLEGTLFAQQTPLFSQYYLNPYLLNPSFAGDSEDTRAFLSYRKQWTGIDGAPETQAFSIDGSLRDERMGLGILVFNDVTNILGRTNFLGSYAYRIDLSPDQQLTFGASLGVLQNRIYFDRVRVEDDTDPNLLNNVDNKTVLDGAIGLNYKYKRFTAGLAVLQVFQNEINYQNTSDFKTLDFSLIRHYTMTLGYTFTINKDFTVEPIVLVRVAQGLSPQFDVTGVLNYREKLWAAIAYRSQIGAHMSLGFAIDDKFIVNYGYEIPTSKIRAVAGGSHEFTLGIRLNSFGSGKRQNLGVSSSGSKIDQSIVDNLRKENQAQYERMDVLEQANLDLQRKVNKQKEEITAIRAVIEGYKSEMEKMINENEVKISKEDDFDEEGDYFLVIGAFKRIENSKSFQKIIKRETGVNTRIVQNHRKSWFLIYTETPESFKEVGQKIKDIKEGELGKYVVGEPWLYKKRSAEDAEE